MGSFVDKSGSSIPDDGTGSSTRHSHENMPVLEQLGDINGKLKYRGVPVVMGDVLASEVLEDSLHMFVTEEEKLTITENTQNIANQNIKITNISNLVDSQNVKIDAIESDTLAISALAEANKQDIDTLKTTASIPDVRQITFVINSTVLEGIQQAHIPFLFDGEIQEVSAYCSEKGIEDTFLKVEKSRIEDQWNSTTDDDIKILSGDYFDDKSHKLENTDVQIGDIFRVNVEQSGDIQNLTVSVKVKLNKNPAI